MAEINRGPCACCVGSTPTTLQLACTIWFTTDGVEIPPTHFQITVIDQANRVIYGANIEISNCSTVIGNVGSSDSYAETVGTFTFTYSSTTYRCDFTSKTPFYRRYTTSCMYLGGSSVTSVTFTDITTL